MLAASLVTATLLYAIDSTIVNVALPHMQGSLQATQEQIAWVVTSYLVASVVLTPIAGWLAMRFGIRRSLQVAVVGFTLCSVLCGVATTLTEMVIFRAFQGAFGTALILLSQITLVKYSPPEQYPRIMSIWASAVLIGPVIGPTLGGYLTDTFSWRWAFYINLPIGLLGWLGVTATMPKDGHFSKRPFDWTGCMLLSCAIGLFQLMLDRGQTKDWFESTEIVAEAFFAALTFSMYLAHLKFQKHPFVDFAVFRNRNFTACMLIQTLAGAFVIAPGTLLPLFLQQIQYYSPSDAGELMAVRGGASLVGMLIAGRLASRFDGRSSMVLGAVIVCVSLVLASRFSVDTPPQWIVIASVLLGLGMPLMFIPTQVLAFATIPDSLRTEAGVVLRVALSLGGGIGISLCFAELARTAQTQAAYLGEHFTPYSLSRWLAVGGMPSASPETAQLVGEVQRQALAIAYENVYLMLAGAALLVIPFAMSMRKAKQVSSAAVNSAEM